MGREQPASHYDSHYAKGRRRARKVTHERHLEAAKWVVGPSVLDLGCGIALIADMIDDLPYVGVDFSPVAIRKSKGIVKNPYALFMEGEFGEVIAAWPPWAFLEQFGTVLLLEVLEHLEDPTSLLEFAHQRCAYRMIVMVPRDMRAPGHVKRSWEPEEIEELVGPLSTCYLCGGPNNDWWWLAVHDKGVE